MALARLQQQPVEHVLKEVFTGESDVELVVKALSNPATMSKFYQAARSRIIPTLIPARILQSGKPTPDAY
jgi:hypothetical protein